MTAYEEVELTELMEFVSVDEKEFLERGESTEEFGESNEAAADGIVTGLK